MSIGERLVEQVTGPESGGLGRFRLGINAEDVAVHGLDGREEALPAREFAQAHFASPLGGEWTALHPAGGAAVQEIHALLAGHEQLLLRVSVPLHRIEIVRLVELIVEEGGLPRLLGIGGFLQRENLDALALAGGGLVAAPVQRHAHQIEFARGILHPPDAMDGRLVRQRDGLPLLRAVGRGHEIEERAAVRRVVGIPARARGDLAPAVAVDVHRRDANVVDGRELLGDDVLFPRRILVPDDEVFVREQDVGLLVAVHVGNGDAVADLHGGIDIHGLERRRGGRGGDGDDRP